MTFRPELASQSVVEGMAALQVEGKDLDEREGQKRIAQTQAPLSVSQE